MIEFCKPYFSHKDDRGEISGIIQKGEWMEVNIIRSKKNTVRGGHYHKHTHELFIILSGEIEVMLQDKFESCRVLSGTVKKGDVFIINPYVWHTFNIKKNSTWINMLDKPINAVDKDMYRF